LAHPSHSDQLVDIARDVFGRGDSFVQKITGSKTVDRPLQRIREFRNRTEPGIVVTVDMLSTGVDIPDLEYIVFLRPVKSRILFEQMLGRGTRKGEQYPDKSHYVVFDCFDGTLLEYFRNTTAMTAEPPQKEARTVSEIIEAIWDNRDREYKPADYLTAFAQFVKDNPEHVDAIGILLSRPKDWKTSALTELREKLAATPQRFTERTLQEAHKLRYDKALADIISMVKHAADSGSPLLTAEERAERAFS